MTGSWTVWLYGQSAPVKTKANAEDQPEKTALCECWDHCAVRVAQAVFMQGGDRSIHMCGLFFFLALGSVSHLSNQFPCQRFSKHLNACRKTGYEFLTQKTDRDKILDVRKIVPIGTVTIIVVPWPAAVWISNLLSSSAARARIFPNPKPSYFSNNRSLPQRW